MKLTLRIIVAIVLLLLIAVTSIVVYFVRVTGGEGSSALEQWIGSELRSVAAAHLNAELSFENPDYQYPLTIVVENIRLTVPDPAGAGEKVDIIRIGKATLTVAEIPETGKPLQIERVVLEQPQFSFVNISATDARLIGFSNLVKTSDQPPAAEPSIATPSTKITDVFRIRLVHILNGTIHYDPRDSDKRAMMLDRINMALNVEPDEQGWYKLSTRIDRAPISELMVNGRFNLNDNIAEIAELSLAVELGGDNQSLPPQMQRALADHDLRGKLTAKAKGTIKFDDWINAKIDLDVALNDGNVSFGDYRLNLPHVSLAAAMTDRKVIVHQLNANLLSGTLAGSGEIQVEAPFYAEAKMRGDELRIHQVLKAAAIVNANAKTNADTKGSAEAPPPVMEELPFRGIASFQVAARAPAGSITTQLSGTGHFSLREGRIINVPAINQFEDGLAGITGSKNIKGTLAGANDSIDLQFNFKNDRMRIDKLDYRSAIVAARGKGEMLLDGFVLNLIVHGGPIEKLQSLLGPVGDLTALLTDRVAKYHITGPVSDPKVKAIIAEGVFDKLFGGD